MKNGHTFYLGSASQDLAISVKVTQCLIAYNGLVPEVKWLIFSFSPKMLGPCLCMDLGLGEESAGLL